MRSAIRTILAFKLALASLAATANPALDHSFDNDGLKLISSVGPAVQAIASCPTEGGSIAVVSYDAATGDFVTSRLLPNGALDTAFSADGIEREAGTLGFDASNTVMGCLGVGNGNADDDAIAIAIVRGDVGTNPDQTRLLHLNLNSGKYASGYSGQTTNYNLSQVVAGTSNQPRTRLGSLIRHSNGDWLLVGGISTGGWNPWATGMVVRFASSMQTIVRSSAPGNSDHWPEHIAAIRQGGDGMLHAVASGSTFEDDAAVMHLRLDSETLVQNSIFVFERGDDFRVHRGRIGAGGTLLVAASRTLPSSTTTQAVLIVARDNTLSTILLPLPQPLGGFAAALNVETAARPTATGATDNRAVFAASLDTGAGAARGYYVAVVRLGNGSSIADTVDTRFAEAGSGSFHFAGQDGDCWMGQGLGNISSWGVATALVGSAAPACDSGIRHPLVARVDTDPYRIFKDSFD